MISPGCGGVLFADRVLRAENQSHLATVFINNL
jgi:hypothetical protein